METFDVVIIGSGLGGLLSAVLLAKEGMSVCVVEKDKQIGGCLQTFSLQKTIFDSCVHYIGGMEEGHTLHRIFSYAGLMKQLQLKSLDKNGFDRIAFGDEDLTYPQATGLQNFVEQLQPYFPNETEALQRYVKTLEFTGDHFPLYRLRRGNPEEKSVVSHWPLSQTIEKLTADPRLQNVLLGNNLLYAGRPGHTPFYLHALVLESYIHSAHKVVPGSSQIAKFLWKELQQHGGVVFRNSAVTRLVEKDGMLQYAETAEGQRFYGKRFIGNVHPKTLLSLLETKLIKPVFRNRMQGLEETSSAFLLNIVLRPGVVPHQNHNLYWHLSNDVWAGNAPEASGDWPTTLAFYFTESVRYPGFAESVSLLTYMPFSAVSKWAATENRAGNAHSRGHDYEDFKEQQANKVLQTIYRRYPSLKGNIVAYSAATPLTFRDYTDTPEGSMYGILKKVDKPHETTVATRTRIPNLLLTGQNVNLHGVLGVSITAVATAAEWLGMDYLLKKI